MGARKRHFMPKSLLGISIIIAIAWTLIVFLSYAWNVNLINSTTKELAAKEARTHFLKDMAFRLWATSHGGVYVRPSERTPPNPYLSHVRDRDITTKSGLKLTLMNPAYMLRQLMNDYDKLYQVRGHITSLKPLNPINEPDAWEKKALVTFRDGKREVFELTEFNGRPYLRLIRPMITAKGCLKCHGFQGYKVGDIRGGVGVSVPYGPYLSQQSNRIDQLRFTHTWLWLAGLGIIATAVILLRKPLADRKIAQEDLAKSEKYFRSLLYSMHEDIIVIDQDYRITDVNNLFLTTTGHSKDNVIGRHCYEVTHCYNVPCDRHGELCPLKSVFETAKSAECIHEHTTPDGNKVKVDILFSPLKDKNGQVTHVIEAARDVTDQIRTADELKIRSYDLDERFRELNCLYQITNIIRTPGIRPEDVFQASSDLIPPSLKYPDVACARVVFEGSEFRSDDFISTIWRQAAKIKLGDQAIGSVEVFYTHDYSDHGDNPFTKEEINLINAIAEQLGEFIKARNAEKTLMESEEKYRTLVENANEAICVAQDQKLIFANPKTSELTGYTQDELTRLPFIDFIHPDDRKKVAERHRQLFAGISPSGQYQCRIIDKSGHVKLVELNLIPIKWQGRPAALIFIMDITLRRKHELARRASLTMNQGMADSTIDNIIEFGLEESVKLTDSRIGFFHFVNKDQKTISLQKWSKETLAQCKEASRTERYKIEDAGTWVDCLLDGEPVIHNDYDSLSHKKGLPSGHVPVTRYATFPVIEDGFIVAIVGVGNKIMEYTNDDIDLLGLIAESTWNMVRRKKAEMAEKQAASLLVETQQIARVGSLSHDYETGEVMWSEELYRILGYSAGEIMPSMGLLHDHIHPDEKEMFLEAENSLIEMGQDFNVEYRIIRNDGIERTVSSIASIQRDKAGKPIRHIGSIQDITESVLAKKQRDTLESQLVQAQKMEAIGTLAGGIAHDFNNILSAIIGYGQLASESLSDDHPIQENLKQMLIASYRASDLVRQILSFSRQTKPETKPIKIAPLIKESLKLIRSTVPATIEIQQNISADTEMVLADPTHIHQTIMNLCTNACQAMRNNGGILHVSLQKVHLEKHNASDFWNLSSGPYFDFCVSDTGEGMDQATMERVFDPFFTTKGVGCGTGLGLSVVHGIIRNLGGAIKVSSEKGKGSKFQVFLPITETDEAGLVIPQYSELSRGIERILFIDDEEVLAELGKRILERLGYHVTSFTSSTEALKQYRTHPKDYDLIITDQTMPGITGIELCREVLKINPQMPIILCTGFSEKLTEKDSIKYGIKKFLFKPLTPNELAISIRQVMDKYSTFTKSEDSISTN